MNELIKVFVKTEPPEQVANGFILVEQPRNDSYRGCLELRDDDDSVRVFFWINNIAMPEREIGREFILAVDPEFRDIILEAIVYFTAETQYFRFDMFDKNLEDLVRFSSLEEDVFSVYYRFIVKALKCHVLPDVRKNPGHEHYSVSFEKGSAEDFPMIMGLKLRDAIIEMRYLMPTT